MAASSLQALRPRDNSAQAIASALQRMADAVAELRAERAALEGNRRSLLLTGSDGDLHKSDSRIRALQTEVERIELAIDVLQPDLIAARGRDKVERVRSLEAQARDAAEVFRAFWLDRYDKLACAIADGIQSEHAARQTRRAYDQAVQEAQDDPDVAAAGGLPRVELPSLPAAYVGGESKSAAALVCLPATKLGPPIAWPAQNRSGALAAYSN